MLHKVFHHFVVTLYNRINATDIILSIVHNSEHTTLF